MNRNGRGREEGPLEDDFTEMLERTYTEPSRLEPGEKVEARIIGITSEFLFLDLGRKGEGILDRKEFQDDDGNLTVGEGDTVQAYFVGTRNNEMWFATRIGGKAVVPEQIEDAWRNGIPVEGTVEREVKGGFSIRLAAGFRGFCPHSQIGEGTSDSRSETIGRRLLFRVTKLEGKGRNLVLSHRVLLEERRREEKGSLRETMREGMTAKGRIRSVRDFGVFVTVGPIEGLVPASEIGWDRGGDLQEMLSPGQEVDVVVLRLDWERERFTFSMKQTLPDPWGSAERKFPAGSVHAGRVSRLAPFGAFVSLEPGVDGLIHVSKLGGGKRIRHPGEAVSEGQELPVRVDSVDREKRRISLSLHVGEYAEGAYEKPEDYREYLREEEPPSVGSLGEALKAKLEEKKKK